MFWPILESDSERADVAFHRQSSTVIGELHVECQRHDQVNRAAVGFSGEECCQADRVFSRWPVEHCVDLGDLLALGVGGRYLPIDFAPRRPLDGWELKPERRGQLGALHTPSLTNLSGHGEGQGLLAGSQDASAS